MIITRKILKVLFLYISEVSLLSRKHMREGYLVTVYKFTKHMVNKTQYISDI